MVNKIRNDHDLQFDMTRRKRQKASDSAGVVNLDQLSRCSAAEDSAVHFNWDGEY